MASTEIKLTARVNRGRLNSMNQQAKAAIRRAKKGDRPAMLHRHVTACVRDCVRIEGWTDDEIKLRVSGFHKGFHLPKGRRAPERLLAHERSEGRSSGGEV